MDSKKGKNSPPIAKKNSKTKIRAIKWLKKNKYTRIYQKKYNWLELKYESK